MALRRVAVHYDVISPYSWVGFEQLHRHHRLWKDDSVKLELKPTFISGIMKASGNTPPGMVQNKGIYMIQDITRLNKFVKRKFFTTFPPHLSLLRSFWAFISFRKLSSFEGFNPFGTFNTFEVFSSSSHFSSNFSYLPHGHIYQTKTRPLIEWHCVG